MKKPRAKLTKPSKQSQVAAYYAAHPSAPADDVAKALKMTVRQVYSMRYANSKKQKSVATDNSALDERDIVAISRIGVAKTERILKLLKQLETK